MRMLKPTPRYLSPLLLLLGACAGDGINKEYQESRLVAPLEVPADLDRPSPDGGVDIKPLSGEAIRSLRPEALLVPPQLSAEPESARAADTGEAGVRSKLKEDANGVAYLDIAMRYDQAWRNVRLALMSSGFTLTDMNRSAGLFYIRYRDPERGDKQREEFTLNLLEVGESSRLLVRDTDDRMLGGATARRILAFIADNL